MKINIKKGDKFNMLTVIKEVDSKRLPSGQINRVILCKCDCGNEKSVRLVHLVRGGIRSCGCLSGGLHGESGSKLHNIWRGMINRTSRTSYKEYYLYGGRGIKVCSEWKKYIPFRDWALKNGFKEGLQIDRIDVDGDYNPDNCRFVEPLINCCNRRNTKYVTYKGKKISYALLLHEKGLIKKRATITKRIERGMSLEEAINKPIKKGNYKGFIKKTNEA